LVEFGIQNSINTPAAVMRPILPFAPKPFSVNHRGTVRSRRVLALASLVGIKNSVNTPAVVIRPRRAYGNGERPMMVAVKYCALRSGACNCIQRDKDQWGIDSPETRRRLKLWRMAYLSPRQMGRRVRLDTLESRTNRTRCPRHTGAQRASALESARCHLSASQEHVLVRRHCQQPLNLGAALQFFPISALKYSHVFSISTCADRRLTSANA
jgi:hypothetical protein